MIRLGRTEQVFGDYLGRRTDDGKLFYCYGDGQGDNEKINRLHYVSLHGLSLMKTIELLD
jgi:hypothetical protein